MFSYDWYDVVWHDDRQMITENTIVLSLNGTLSGVFIKVLLHMLENSMLKFEHLSIRKLARYEDP